MLLSHTHQFIFVHIYKVAGQSVRKALAPFTYYPGGVIGRAADRLFHLSYLSRFRKLHVHSTAAEIKKHLDEELFRNYFKFTFVRNPWDWQVSLFHFMRSQPLHRQYRLALRFEDFDEYIAWRITQEPRLQKAFVVDESGKMLVDFVGKFENITDDFAKICDLIKVTASLPHMNRTSHRPYQEYYNLNTRELIRKHFEEDIELFGYEFE